MKIMASCITALIIFSFFPTTVMASTADVIEVKDAVVRYLPKTSMTTAAYMTLKNNSNAEIKMVGASSTKAKITELHTHQKKDDMMEMVKIDSVTIAAKASIELKPGGLHIMLIDVTSPTVLNEHVEIKLKFADGSEKAVLAKTIDPSSQFQHHPPKTN
jgi:copper(I)-binding protein